MGSYRLLSYADGRGRPAGMLVGDKVYDVGAEFKAAGVDIPAGTSYGLLQRWDESRAALEKAADAPATEGKNLGDVKLLAPFPHPGTIYCAGANYYDHYTEFSGKQLDRTDLEPLFFLKAHSSIVGPHDDVKVSADYSQKYDWEVEIAMVIGKEGRKVSMDDALSHVAGYMIMNDLSARDRGNREDWPFGMDWFRHKSFMDSAPMGPWMTPASEIPDPQNLWMKTEVSGTIRQDSSSTDMVFDCRELIVSLSDQITLKPGDIIATGTCAGVGTAHGVFLKPGDTVKQSVEGLGEITNKIVAE